MKVMMLIGFLLIPMVAHTDNYVVTTTPPEQQMVETFAARLNVTNTQVVRRMCDAGMASFRGQYLKLITEGRDEVFKQMTPGDRTTVCAIFASYGKPCPTEEP
jgi:hypothetical protein